MRKELMDTNIPQNAETGLFNDLCYDVAAAHIGKVIDVIVNGVTSCLAEIKSKEYPVAFVFNEKNGEFIIGSIVEYFKNEDDETKPGNWNYSWTFNKEDIPENSRIIDIYDDKYASYFRASAHTKYGMGFETATAMADVFTYILKTVNGWLDDNANENEESCVFIDGIIQFRVVVENGEKIKSAEPDGEIKQLIKDDSAIEV